MPAKKKTAKKTTRKTNVTMKTTATRPKTHVAIIIDSSSSMVPLREQVISGFNNQIATLKASAKEQDVKVSCITFSNTVHEARLWNQPLETVRALEANDYLPYGNTALLDAVGSTLDKLNALKEGSDPDTAFLVTIMTDGEENSSRTFSSQTVATLVKVLQNTGRWTFTYMGANQDLSKVSLQLNIPIQNTMTFVPSSVGASQAWGMNSGAFTGYMATRSMGNMQSGAMYSNNGSTADAGQQQNANQSGTLQQTQTQLEQDAEKLKKQFRK